MSQPPPTPTGGMPPNPPDAQPGRGSPAAGGPTAWWEGGQVPPWTGPVAATSGLAIASLVLSILWVGGLGSLLAVIFAGVGLSRIKRSGGRLTGRSLATAGLVIGIVGLAGSVLFYVLVGAVVEQVGRTETLSMGQRATLSGPGPDGIGSVAVDGYVQPASATLPFVTPDRGKVFAAATVEVCAGSGGSQTGPDVLAFSLVFPHGVTAPATIGAVSPSLGDVRSLPSHGCATAKVTFEVANGARPTSVRWRPNLVTGPAYQWTVAR